MCATTLPPFPRTLLEAARLGGILAILLALAGCHRAGAPARAPGIATTTSYLEAAAADLLGQDIQVLRLAEPGTCPGHFDIRPSQVAQLRACRALLRFDFQRSLDARFASGGTNSPRIAEITLRTGMCRPDTYLAACQQVADHLVALDLISRAHAEARLRAIASRLDALAQDATNRVAQSPWASAPVIASAHQRDFCAWLGLNVVASFRAADVASIGEIEEAVAAGTQAQAQLVIANRPEGRRVADAIAGHLGARVVVCENFPGLRKGSASFDAMIRSNLAALLEAAR